MGSIAICVCPNDDKGDPFIACMKAVDQAEAASGSQINLQICNKFLLCIFFAWTSFLLNF